MTGKKKRATEKKAVKLKQNKRERSIIVITQGILSENVDQDKLTTLINNFFFK